MCRKTAGGRTSPIRLVAVLLCLGLGGCAASATRTGDRLIRAGRYEDAIEALLVAKERDPSDAAIQRQLGVALLRAGRSSEARERLREANALAPREPRSLFFLARAEEANGDTAAALSAYAACGALRSELRRAARSHLTRLGRVRAERQIRAALARERTLSLIEPTDNSVVVPDFTDLAQEDRLAPLKRGLAAMVITDLSHVRAFRVLERERLQILQAEMARGAEEVAGRDSTLAAGSARTSFPDVVSRLRALRSKAGPPFLEGTAEKETPAAISRAVKSFQREHGLRADGKVGPKTEAALLRAVELQLRADRASRRETVAALPLDPPRIGRLLGARHLIQGSFLRTEQNEIELRADLVDVPSAATRALGDGQRGPIERVLHLEKKLVYETLDALGITPTQDERREIDRLPTENLAAFLLYSRALTLEDEGNYDAALDAFQAAVAADPDFQEAADAGVEVPLDPDAADAVEDQAAVEGDSGDQPPPTDDLGQDLLGSTGSTPTPDGGGEDGGGDVTPVDGTKISAPVGTIPEFPDPPGGSR